MKLLYVLLAWHTMGEMKSYDVAGPWMSKADCEQAGYMYVSRWHDYSPLFECVEVKMEKVK